MEGLRPPRTNDPNCFYVVYWTQKKGEWSTVETWAMWLIAAWWTQNPQIVLHQSQEPWLKLDHPLSYIWAPTVPCPVKASYSAKFGIEVTNWFMSNLNPRYLFVSFLRLRHTYTIKDKVISRSSEIAKPLNIKHEPCEMHMFRSPCANIRVLCKLWKVPVTEARPSRCLNRASR